MIKKIIVLFFLYVIISLPYKPPALAFEDSSLFGGIAQIGMAFMTNLAIHETGHAVVANYVGADGIDLNFFTNKNGKFFLGLSNVDKIDEKSRLPYSMGGEIAVNLTFEYALQEYRRGPTLYNKSLLFFSGTDFVWYSLYAFYLTNGHPHFDPVAVSEETGLSEICSKGPTPILRDLFREGDAGALLRKWKRRSFPDRREEIKKHILAGGYPTPSMMTTVKARRRWFDSYRQTYNVY